MTRTAVPLIASLTSLSLAPVARAERAALGPPPGPPGEFKWDGATGVYLVVDRAQDMFLAVTQDSPSGRMLVNTTIKKIVYDAFEN